MSGDFMDTLSRSGSAALESLALIAVIAGAFAYFRFAFTKSTIDQLKVLTEALTARVDMLEQERVEMAERLKTLESENSVLRSTISGETRLQEIKSLIDIHHTDLVAQISALKTSYHEQVLAEIRALKTH